MLAHVIIEAEKPLDLQEGSWRPRRAKGTNSSPSLGLKAEDRYPQSERENSLIALFDLCRSPTG